MKSTYRRKGARPLSLIELQKFREHIDNVIEKRCTPKPKPVAELPVRRMLRKILAPIGA